MSRDPGLVAVVVADGAPLFETSVPISVFGADRSDTGGPRFSVLAVTADGSDAAATTGGLVLGRLAPLAEAADAGILVVPTWRDPVEPPPAALVSALRDAYAEGAILVGLCLGAFVLAAAGVLDGRRATTHWRWADTFRELFPDVELDPAVLYVDEGRVITSAGTAAGLDACLHLVRRERGARAAAAVARRMVVPPHRAGGQAQFIDTAEPDLATAGPFGELTAWAAGNLGEELTVDRMAARVSLSRRTFDRQFRSLTGTSPLQWLVHQRIITAQQLLETTQIPVDRIARSVGFSGAVAMRPHFRARVGVSPQEYRQTFGGAASPR